MKIVTVSYRHSAKMTHNYQSAESSVELVAQVEEGELASEVLAHLKKCARAAVREDFAKRTTAPTVSSASAQTDVPVAAPSSTETTTPVTAPGCWGIAARVAKEKK